ncbi:MAG: DUF4381 domain-containing protein [Bacteroidota bacterium]
MKLVQDTIHITGIEPMIAPDAVPFWPPAPGWYVLAGLLMLLLVFLATRWVVHRRRNRYRVTALQQLNEIERRAGGIPDQKELLALNSLLKKTALTVYPREEVASLTGKDWMAFLAENCRDAEPGDVVESLLTRATFQPPGETKIDTGDWKALLFFSERWIRHHRTTSM